MYALLGGGRMSSYSMRVISCPGCGIIFEHYFLEQKKQKPDFKTTFGYWAECSFCKYQIPLDITGVKFEVEGDE